jgi:hypothetical protein
MWTKIYNLKLVTDDQFTSCECRHCQLAKAEHPPVRLPHSNPAIRAVDRTDALIADFNVIYGAKSKKKARSGAKSLFNMMYARSGCVTTTPCEKHEEITAQMVEIMTCFVLNFLRKHGWEIRVIFVDKESTLISASLRALLGSPPFNIEIRECPTEEHQFIGAIESFHRVQTYKMRTCLSSCPNVPEDLCDRVAAEYVTPLYSRLPTRTGSGKSPMEIITGTIPPLSWFITFGARAVLTHHNAAPGKTSMPGREAILIGYDLQSAVSHSRLFYVPHANRVVTSRAYTLITTETPIPAILRETLPELPESALAPSDLPTTPQPLLPETLPPPAPHAEQIAAVAKLVGFQAIHRQRSALALQADRRNIDDISCLVAYKAVYSYTQAMKQPRAPAWRAEMKREIDDLLDVYKILERKWLANEQLPTDAEICNPLRRLEEKECGRLRARLTIDGSTQKADASLHESFYSPTPSRMAIKMALVYAMARAWGIDVIDIEKAFLLSTKQRLRSKRVFMRWPPGVYPEYKGLLVEVIGTLYGLRSAPAEWYNTLKEVLDNADIRRLDQEPCVYIKRSKTGKIILIVIVHVDDCLSLGSEKHRTACRDLLSSRYKFRLQHGPRLKYVGMNINELPDGLLLSGNDYLRHLQTTFPPTNPNHIWNEPMAPKSQFPTANHTAGPRQSEYRTLAGALQYAASYYSPWSLFAATRASARASEGTHEQYAAAQRIMEYLYTHPVGIYIPRNRGAFDKHTWSLVGYTDSDLANHPTAKSTSGGLIYLNDVLIHFYSRLQSTVALSTFEAEYHALCEMVREILALLNILHDLDINAEPATIYCDQAKVVRSCYSGQILTSRQVRHIIIRFEFIVDHLSKGVIKLVWISTIDNLADPLTKPVHAEDIDRLSTAAHLTSLNLHSTP